MSSVRQNHNHNHNHNHHGHRAMHDEEEASTLQIEQFLESSPVPMVRQNTFYASWQFKISVNGQQFYKGLQTEPQQIQGVKNHFTIKKDPKSHYLGLFGVFERKDLLKRTVTISAELVCDNNAIYSHRMRQKKMSAFMGWSQFVVQGLWASAKELRITVDMQTYGQLPAQNEPIPTNSQSNTLQQLMAKSQSDDDKDLSMRLVHKKKSFEVGVNGNFASNEVSTQSVPVSSTMYQANSGVVEMLLRDREPKNQEVSTQTVTIGANELCRHHIMPVDIETLTRFMVLGSVPDSVAASLPRYESLSALAKYLQIEPLQQSLKTIPRPNCYIADKERNKKDKNGN